MFEIIDVAAAENGKPLEVLGNYSLVWLVLAGGILSVVVYGHLLLQRHRQKFIGFLATGPSALAILIGTYMAFTAVDHLSFFTHPDSGFVNWDLIRQTRTDVEDVQCSGPLLIVDLSDPGKAVYRCPEPVQIVLGRFTGQPFIPWPGYTEGESPALAAAVNAMMANAEHITDDAEP